MFNCKRLVTGFFINQNYCLEFYRKKAFKLLQKLCNYTKIEDVDALEMSRIIRDDIKNAKVEINQDALEELILRIPTNIQSWKNEFEKLKLFNTKLTIEDVCSLVPKTLEDDIFMMVNAVLKKDLKKAVFIMEDLLVAKRDQIEMVSILANQFRLMFQCACFMEAHYSEREIVDELNIHPYRVKKALEACRNTTVDGIFSLLSSLADLDQKIKLGRIDKSLGFELFLVEATR